jgi:plastocyanin
MRKIPLVAAVAVIVFVFGGAPLSAASKAPVNLGQTVTNKGTKDVSTKSKATVQEDLDDKYFTPTFIKAKAGEKITFKVTNEGSLPHTFTSDELSVDKQVDPGKSVKFTVKVPGTGAVFQFHCAFHEASGMVGAVYTKAGGSTGTKSSSDSTSSESGYGY